MSGLLDFMSGRFAADLVSALLHTLWQALAIAGLLYVFLKSTAAKNTNLRYGAGVVSLVLIVICGLVTWAVLDFAPAAAPAKTSGNQVAVPAAGDPASRNDASPPVPANHETAVLPAAGSAESAKANWQATAMFVWLAGVGVMLCRTAWTVLGVSRLRRSCRPLEDARILGIVEELKETMRIAKRVGLAVTDRIISPGVIGLVQPTLLLPISMMTGMDIEDIKAVLAHELAHIKRYDCLVNFCQMVVEAILFFNPALWWVSRQIRIEREACCDAAGVAITGRRTKYAEVLYEWAQKLSGQSPTTAAAMVGFGGDVDKGRMLDRMQRLVVKGHRPRVRISWYMTITMLLALAVVLVGLWQGTNATVKLAGKLLTPQERIEKMAEIEKTYGQPTYDPGYRDDLSDEEKVTLGGIVRTWDGLPLPKNTYLTVYSRHASSSASKSVSINREDPGHGMFSTTSGYGTVHIWGRADGYSPFFAGPFKFEAGDKKLDVEVVFEEISYAQIQLLDAESGDPVEGIELSGGHNFVPNRYHHTVKVKTDKEGKADVDYVDQVAVTLRAKAEEYEETTFEKIMLSREEPTVVKVRKGIPTTGIVLSKKTGQPVVGAQIRIQERLAPHGMSYGRDQGDVIATTDTEGKFSITRLNSANKYILAVKAEKYAYSFLYDIYAGNNDIEVELGDEIIIKGKIVGPLEKLTERKGETVISYTYGHDYEHNSYWDSSKYAPVTISEEGAFFEISDIWGNRLKIGTGRYVKRLNLDDEEIPELVVIDLADAITEEGKEFSKRKIIFEFDTPKGAPSIRGNIRVNSREPGKEYSEGKLVDIVDGCAETEIYVPNKFGYQLADTVGYWFKGDSGVAVDSGEEPFVVKVDVVPSGTIFGEVLGHDGKAVGNTLVGFHAVEKSKLLGKTNFGGVEGKNSASSDELETKYSIHPLPLEGTYRVIAHRGYMYVVSERIRLTEKGPIQKVDLTYPKGVTIRGKVLKPDGGGATGIEYDLGFRANESGSFGHSNRFTDALGGFELEDVNPEADGEYTLRIESRKGYRGQKVKIEDFEKEIVITLEQGSVATGQIIDDKTGWPVPEVEVSAYYSDYKSKIYENLNAEGKTDKNGRFRFSNLKEGREYLLSHSGGRKVGGGTATILGGNNQDVTVRVELYEWSKLKPQKPQENE